MYIYDMLHLSRRFTKLTYTDAEIFKANTSFISS
jgi:hypothetical protein